MHREQASGEECRDDGREGRQRHATAVPLTVSQARKALGPQGPQKLNQTGQTSPRPSNQGYPGGGHLGEKGNVTFILNWGKSIPG